MNFKTLFVIYLLTRISIVLILNYGSWNGTSMLCYTVDCKFWWNNAQQVVNGLNPYQVWRENGGYGADISKRADDLPIFFLLISIFAWFWKSVWAVFIVFFLFDILNIYFISKLAKFKRVAVLLYLFAPSILRGLFFPEDELLITFGLASIYFLVNRRYTLSTLMLALWFNTDFYPIAFFPILLLNMDVIKKVPNRFFPEIVNWSRLIQQTTIFILAIIFSHLFYFPDWYMVYEFRSIHYALAGQGFGIWQILSTSYYPFLLLSLFFLFYVFAYVKNLDIKTGYLLGSLIFISLFPRFSVDHLITLIPLFLIWTRLNLLDVIFWIFLMIGISLEFIGLPTIGIVSPSTRMLISLSILIGFYLVIINYLTKNETKFGLR